MVTYHQHFDSVMHAGGSPPTPPLSTLFSSASGKLNLVCPLTWTYLNRKLIKSIYNVLFIDIEVSMQSSSVLFLFSCLVL